MTNAQRLERELLNAGRRGCLHRELEAAGVAYISIEIARLRRRGAHIAVDRLPRSGDKRYRMLIAPGSGRAVDPASPPGDAGGDDWSGVDSSPGAGTLFELEPVAPRSPYDVAGEAA